MPKVLPDCVASGECGGHRAVRSPSPRRAADRSAPKPGVRRQSPRVLGHSRSGIFGRRAAIDTDTPQASRQKPSQSGHIPTRSIGACGTVVGMVTDARTHSRVRLWVVALLVATVVGIPMLHCLNTSDRHLGLRAQHEHSALPTAPEATAADLTAATAHPHSGGTLHAAWCAVVDAAVDAIRAYNPQRLLLVVGVAIVAAAAAGLWSTRGSRGPPAPRQPPRTRSGRHILTTLCISRR